MDMQLIKCHQVVKYDVKQAYNFTINKHDIICISGKNGSGKTTLTKLILGYIDPDHGYIDKKKLKIGYLPEHIQFPMFMKVNRYLELLCKIKKTTLNVKWLAMLELPIHKYIYELSNGNKQKLGIISACMGHPDLIILDEPLAALDELGRKQFIQMLESLKQMGQTMMIITHYPSVIRPLCNKQIKL